LTEPDCPAPSTLASGAVGGLAARLLEGAERDLLAPYSIARPDAPGELPTPRLERGALARGLEVANASYGHPRAAELAARLADPATAVVVTGQQTGLFGGPLMSLVKAASAVRWAEAIEATGRPAVAVFWMATEDHDFREAAEARFLDGEELFSLTLGEDPRPLAPIGLRTVGAEVGPLLAELEQRFPSDWFRRWTARLAELWRPEARFGDAFARTHLALLGARAPLYLDSMLPELKRAQRPHLATLVERREELEHGLGRREAEILDRGHALQVAPQPGASPLFLVRGGERRRVEWRPGERWGLRGLDGEWPLDELLATIEDNPAAVSPGVLARPAVQDAVLAPALFLVGPGEMSYLAQAGAASEVLGIPAPAVSLRSFALVLDQRSRDHLAELGGTLDELVADGDAIEARLAARAGGGFVAPLRDQLLAEIDTLREPAVALDATLEKPWERTRESVTRALDAFAHKVEASAARRDELAAGRLAQLRRLAVPGGAPQERVLSTSFFA
ncbi:MAG TPA: bacillithiol biosynthesis cysteine-adding enzyme BshC, partial [Thermoanaerobaculia bacterium]|nr:bacillithiol biosynthesis cysteine-adding enzyme BshC [Thermoanaerobaculia bacterium]